MDDEDANAAGDRRRGRTPEEIAAVTGGDPERIRRAYDSIRFVDKDGNPIDEDGNPIHEEPEEQEP